jgi:hypothetical protein
LQVEEKVAKKDRQKMITIKESQEMFLKKKYKYYVLEESFGYTTIFLLCGKCHKKYASAIELVSKYMKRLVFMYELKENELVLGEYQDKAVILCEHVTETDNILSLERQKNMK